MSTAALPPAWGEGDSLDRVLRSSVISGRRQRRLPDGSYLVQCINPAHEDRTPSLHISWTPTEHGGRVLFYCPGCGPGLDQRDWAEYAGLDYDDVHDDRRWSLHNRASDGGKTRSSKPARTRRTGPVFSKLGPLPEQIAGKLGELTGRGQAEPAPRPQVCSGRSQHDFTRVESYPYVDAEGTVLQEVVRERCTACGAKNFPSRWTTPTGTQSTKPAGFTPVLYRLPEVLATAAQGGTVWLVEGEKDVHAAEELGLVATTNPGGGANFPAELAPALAGADVRVVLDRDATGWARGVRVHRLLTEAGAASVTLLLPATTEPKSDLADHLEAGHDIDQLVQVPLPAVAAWDALRPVERHLAYLRLCEDEISAQQQVAEVDRKAGRRAKAEDRARFAARWAKESWRTHDRVMVAAQDVQEQALQVPEHTWAQQALQAALSHARAATTLVTAMLRSVDEEVPDQIEAAYAELETMATAPQAIAQDGQVGQVDGANALAEPATTGPGPGWTPRVLPGGGGPGGPRQRVGVRITAPDYDVVTSKDGRLELVEIKVRPTRRGAEQDEELEQLFTRILNCEVRITRREFAESDQDVDDDLDRLRAAGLRQDNHSLGQVQNMRTQTHVVISVRPTPEDELQTYRVPHDKFLDGSFVPNLDVPGLVYQTSRSGRERIVTAINAVSTMAQIVTSYRATGWRQIDGEDVYITASGAIGPRGRTPVVTNMAAAAMARYDLPDPSTDAGVLREAFLTHSAGLMTRFPDRVGAALLGTAYRSVLCPNEWVTVLTASPGVGKTGLAALTMHHLGELWDRTRPVTSLSGNGATMNALRLIAHACKDTLMFLDDNAPTTGVEAAFKRLEEIVRMIHNAEDRPRSSRDGQEVLGGGRPRASALITSEVPPRPGTSGERRALLVPLTRQEISIQDIRALDTLDSRHGRALLTSSFLRWISAGTRAAALDRAAGLREEFAAWLRAHPRACETHDRHADKITELWVGWGLMIDFLTAAGALSAGEGQQWRTRVAEALVVAAESSEDPDMVSSTGQRVCELLRYAMGNGLAYAADIRDGSAPEHLQRRVGWISTGIDTHTGMPLWRRSERAIHLGYINDDVVRAEDPSPELVCTRAALEATLKAAASAMTDTSTLDLGTALRALSEEGILKTATVPNPGGGHTVRRLINRTINAESDHSGRPVRGKRIVLRLDALLEDDQDDTGTPPSPPGPSGGWSGPTPTSTDQPPTTDPEEPVDDQYVDDIDPFEALVLDEEEDDQEQPQEPAAGQVTNTAGWRLTPEERAQGRPCVLPGCGQPSSTTFAGIVLHPGCYQSTTVATVSELHQRYAATPHTRASAPAPSTDQPLGWDQASSEPAPQPAHTASGSSSRPAPAPRSSAPARAARAGQFTAACVVVDVDGYYLPGQHRADLPFPITHAGHLEELGRHLNLGTPPLKWRKFPEAGLVVPTEAMWAQLGVPTDVPARASRRKAWFAQTSQGLAFLEQAVAHGWVFGRGDTDPVLRGMTRLRRPEADRGTAAIMFTPGMPAEWGLTGQVHPAAVATRLQLIADALGMPFHASPISTGLDLLRVLMPREVREQLSAANAVDYEGVTPAWLPECEPSFDWTRTPTSTEQQAGMLALFDRGGSYLSTWSSLKIGIGAPEKHGPELGFTATRAGWWLIELPPAGEGTTNPYPDLLDPAGTRAGQQVWVTTPALEYAVAGTGLGLQVQVLESWTWPPERSKAWLSGLYKHLREALEQLRQVPGEDSAAAQYLVKQIYKQLSGHLFSTDSDTSTDPAKKGRPDVLDMHHPYAFHAMRAKARVAILHQVLSTGHKTGTWPLVVSNNDLLGYATDQVSDPAAAWPGDPGKLGRGLGDYKLDRWAPLSAQAPHLRTGAGWGGLEDTRRAGEQW